MKKAKVAFIVFFAPVLFVSLSCVNTRNSVYFAGQQEGQIPSSIPVPENIIAPNDLLSISVSSLSPEASAIYNAPNLTYANVTSYSGGVVQSSGYLVNREGNIHFPILGTIKAAGLTENQLRAFIVKSLTDRKLLVDPIVSVRHLNFKVTVLGEVARPAVLNVPNEKITLLEALGLAGDITIYGKKDNVMLIREVNGVKTIKRLNLNSSELLTSPYYHLLSNDIIYVEPTKSRVASSGRANQVLPAVLSGLSFLAIIISQITRE